MSEERLSKLQKWILLKCYERENKEIYRYHILKFFTTEENRWTGKAIFKGNDRNKAEASITRTLKNLFNKGYIDLSIGHFSGNYFLEDTKKGLEMSTKRLEEMKETGESAISPLTGKHYTIKYMEELNAERKEAIEKRILHDTIMGHNIHRLKLTDEGIELAESLNVKKKAMYKT